MDSWILKQLRATVQSDLRAFIPQGYFESEVDRFQLHDNFEAKKYLSFEMRWGYLAAKLGNDLYFQPPSILTARQVSASELLMNLGMLASSDAALNTTEQLSNQAMANGVPDGNSGNVAAQLKGEQIPILRDNVVGALDQYLQHLTYEEAKPYISLLPESKQKAINHMPQEPSKVINNTISVAGSVSGVIQAGEENQNTKIENNSNSPTKVSIFKWLVNNIATLIIAVVAGVIVITLTKS
jgi:hypothetical protein